MQDSNLTSPAVTPGTYAKLVAVPAIWGGTFIAGRILALALPSILAGLAPSDTPWPGFRLAYTVIAVGTNPGDYRFIVFNNQLEI